MPAQYRLVTRSDFDGLVCAVLLKDLDLIHDIKFVHPKDMQDGLIEIGPGDITTNLPYVPGVGLAFDHHHSETLRLEDLPPNYITDPTAPSAARVVYRHYGGAERFPGIAADMMTAVDKGDSADFTIDEVLHPEGWVLLNFLMDARTGLGRFRTFRISNYHLMMELIDYCKLHSIDEILALPDVRERVDLYFDQAPQFQEQLKRVAQLHGALVELDLRGEEVIHAGNRFVVYALHPDANVSMHVMWGKQQQNTVFAVGKSIFNKTCPVDVGGLMLEFGGGGHEAAGTCQVDHETASSARETLIERLRG